MYNNNELAVFNCKLFQAKTMSLYVCTTDFTLTEVVNKQVDELDGAMIL